MSITSVVNDTVTRVSLINAQKPLPPTISGYSVGGVDDTALDPAGGQTVLLNGTGFLAGATITFDGSAVAVVTYVNPNQLTFTSPAKSAGTYTIYVVNADGGTAIYIPGIIYSVLPTWTTSAGTLGSYYETTSISNTVIASGDAPITYSLFSGSLPTGSTLYANGVITGTAPVDSSSTTYSFTIQATDAQLQDSTRSFSLTINVDAVTWVTPSSGATYTNAVNSAISNVALSATDAAGYTVSYSANALPTGLTLTGSNIAGTPTVIADSSTLLTATAATTNRSAVRTINWSITVANDVYFEYNTLLIPGASTTFVDDASTNNFAVTINGDTKPNSFNPYTPGYYSNYFDGTGDYISVPDNVAFTMAAGDFTLECWVNLSTISGSQIIIGTCDAGGSQGSMSFVLNVNSGTPRIGVGYGGTMYFATAASAITANTWVHIAGVRNGASVYIYVNGIQSTALNMGSLAITDSTQVVAVGRNGAGNFEYVTGYISNVRIVKGTAVYTGAFTPPTLAPLTNAGSTSAAAYPSTTNVDITFASSATSLLTSQSNRFIDTSINEFPVTVSGDTKIQSFQPFTPNSSYSSYGSGYFDGTGDYLTISNSNLALNTGDFTLECWINAPSGLTDKGIFEGRTGGTGTTGFTLTAISPTSIRIYSGSALITSGSINYVNTWCHVAVVRLSGTTTLYINGVSQGTTASLGNLTDSSFVIGAGKYASPPSVDAFFTGYISDFRIVKGTAVYTTAFTPPSAPLTAIANTSLLTLQNNQSVNNSVFLDNSTNNFLVTRNGNTTQGTFSPYGGNWSNYFDGSGDYLSVANNAAFQLGSNNFTVEFWVNFSSLPATNGTQATFFSKWDASQASYVFYLYNDAGTYKLYFTYSTSGSNATDVGNITWNPTVGVTYHLALVRSGSNLLFFVNGTQQGATQTLSATVYNSTAVVTIGVFTTVSPSGPFFNGYISNARQVIGTAVYTTTFTPSTTPLTPITNTVLLTCQSNRLIDNSINNFTITKNGDVSVQRFSPFNPSSLTPTSYSGYFDGTGDYLTTPSNAAFTVGTGDFTIEGWYYLTGIASDTRYLFDCRSGGSAQAAPALFITGGVYTYYVNGAVAASGGVPVANQWVHIALVSYSAVDKLYINGTSVFTLNDGGNYTSSTLRIGSEWSATGLYDWKGYISNFRFVKGVAVYTGAFTPPTAPLQATQTSGTNIAAITGTSTSLLTCQSTAFIDNSTNNFTITAAGNSQPTQQNPFGYTSAATQGYTASTIGGSGYFDGNGDYLQPSSTANTAMMAIANSLITIEFWVYTTTIQAVTAYVTTVFGQFLAAAINGRYMITLAGSGTTSSQQVGFAWTTGPSTSASVTSSTNLNQNSWNHVAITIDSTTPSSSTITIYSNGVGQIFTGNNLSSQTVDNGSPFYIGAEYGGNYQGLSGYLSDFRFLRGQLVYKSNFVPPSAPLLAIQNTTLLTNMTSAGIYDAAMMTTMETVGDAKLSTAVSKFGGTSMSFDGTGDYLQSPIGNFTTAFGTGDFTVELWVNFAANNGTYNPFVRQDGSGTFDFGYDFSTTQLKYNGYGAILTITQSFTIGTWYYIALTRASGSARMFVNGTQVGTTATGDTNNYSNIAFKIAASSYSGSHVLNGYLDDLRITKGYARYTANFTAPTTAFQLS